MAHGTFGCWDKWVLHALFFPLTSSKEPTVDISCQLCVQWLYPGNLNLAMVEVFMPYKSTNATNQCFFLFFFSFSNRWFTNIPLNAPVIDFSLKILLQSHKTLHNIVKNIVWSACHFFFLKTSLLELVSSWSSLLWLLSKTDSQTSSWGFSSPHAYANSPASSIPHLPLSWLTPSFQRSTSSSGFLEKVYIEGKYFEIIMPKHFFFDSFDIWLKLHF